MRLFCFILVKAENISKLSEEDERLAVLLALDGVLGEETRLSKIVDVEIVKDFCEQYINSTSKFIFLAKHLKALRTETIK